MEIPLIFSTISCFYWNLCSRGGNKIEFYLTIAYSYLKSPVNSIVPIKPLKSIIQDPGICFASNNVNCTSNFYSTKVNV